MRHPKNKSRISVRLGLAQLETLQVAECSCGAGDSLVCEIPCSEMKRRELMSRVTTVIRELGQRGDK